MYLVPSKPGAKIVLAAQPGFDRTTPSTSKLPYTSLILPCRHRYKNTQYTTSIEQFDHDPYTITLTRLVFEFLSG